jgi:hypothetical protein
MLLHIFVVVTVVVSVIAVFHSVCVFVDCCDGGGQVDTATHRGRTHASGHLNSAARRMS